MIALGRLRQSAVRRRFDLEAAIAGLVAEARIIMADIGLGLDDAAAIDGGLGVIALAEAKPALDHGIGRVDAVDDDGHPGAAGNDDVKTLAGAGRQHRSDQQAEENGRGYPDWSGTHTSGFRFVFSAA